MGESSVVLRSQVIRIYKGTSVFWGGKFLNTPIFPPLPQVSRDEITPFFFSNCLCRGGEVEWTVWRFQNSCPSFQLRITYGCPAGSSFYQPPPVLPVSRPRRKSLFNKLARESMIFLHDTSRAFILRPIIPVGKILLSRSVVSGVHEPFECQGRRRNSKKDRTSANFEERYVDILI